MRVIDPERKKEMLARKRIRSVASNFNELRDEKETIVGHA